MHVTGASSDSSDGVPSRPVRTRPSDGLVAAAHAGLRRWLPRGHPLPEDIWRLRHRWVMVLLVAQTAALPAFALWRGFSLTHAILEALVPGVLSVLAATPRLPRVARASCAGLGLVVVSAIVVHLSAGAIEAHFHFFVMVPIVALYESWAPFGLSVTFVLVHHGLLGTINSDAVYNHDGAREQPWMWAAIHAALFGAASIAALINWKLHESARGVAVDLSYRATHDPLTELPNRTLMHARVEQALETARSGGERPTMLLLDLDGFKDVNDTVGHVNGDLLLTEVGRRLQSSVRPDDTVSRLGGDEFAVLLANCAPARGEQVATRITELLTEPFVIDGVTLDLEVSIGIATAGEEYDALTLLRHADAAMYSAKENKLGTIRYEPGQESTTLTRLELLGALRRALDADDVLLRYQPKIGLETGQILGVEALARWHHASRGWLQPTEFIPMLEKTTLCHRFTRHILGMALAQASMWAASGHRVPVAVNVSTRCLFDPSFAETVRDALLGAGIDGGLLCIEITENTVMADPERAIGVLSKIRDLGVNISIDDFGTGYSSMAYLRSLPVDELKIDRYFVSDVACDQTNAALVKAAIDLAHNLGLRVVAEGVETEAAETKLRELGCDVGQGFYYAEPRPAHELVLPDATYWLAEPDAAAG